MPSWVKDEATWERAKKEVERKPDMTDDQYWGSVTTVYKNMGGKIGAFHTLDLVAKKLSSIGCPELANQVCVLRDEFSPPETTSKVSSLILPYYRELVAGTDQRWISNWFKEKEQEEKDELKYLKSLGKDSLGSVLSTLTKATKRAFENANWGAAARLMVARDALVADLDPAGGDIPDPEDKKVLEVFSFDTYQGSDPMDGPGIAVKIENGTVQVYIIEDPEEEIYGEVYFTEGETGWTIQHLGEYGSKVFPQDWEVGGEVPFSQFQEWLGGERKRLSTETVNGLD